MQIITICSSANFYRQVVEIKTQLEKQGFKVLIPEMAETMQSSGDYDVSHYKTWFADPGDYHKKGEFMRGHFEEVEKGDAILVVNNEKHGVANYIGGNVLMEMALAFFWRKSIFIMNDMPEESAYLEEIKGFEPIVLHGKIENLPKEYKKINS